MAQSRQRGDGDLTEDLEGVTVALRAALKAQAEGKAERRTTKVQEVAETLRRAAAGRGGSWESRMRVTLFIEA